MPGAYRDAGVGFRTQDPEFGPWGGTLGWNPRVGPWDGTPGCDPRVGPWGGTLW